MRTCAHTLEHKLVHTHTPCTRTHTHTHTHTQINNNGIISFTDSIGTFTPDPFPLAGNTELIAPFWADVDTRGTGRVYYRETAELQLLEKAGSDIRSSFVDHSEFHPSFLVIATWDHVGYYEEKVDKVCVCSKWRFVCTAAHSLFGPTWV